MDTINVKNLSTCAGIYLFTNIVNNKHYVGQAINIRKRIKAHLLASNHPEKYSCLLYPDILKYGLEKFTISILEEVYIDDIVLLKQKLDELEIYYIEKYKSYGEYNKTKGGDYGVLGLKMTEEQRNKIKASVQKRVADGRFAVYAYNINTKEFFEFVNMKEAAEKLNYKESTLRSAKCHKRLLYRTYLLGNSKEEILELEKTKKAPSGYNIEEYYEYIIKASKPYDYEKIYKDLGIKKDAVMKRNQKLRKLGYVI